MAYQYTPVPPFSRRNFGLSLSEVAREAGCSVQRVSRTVQRLKIPVQRIGNMVMVDREGMVQVVRTIKKAQKKIRA